MRNKLKEKIKDFPASPGVYQFIDNNGDILYVGKAKSLKSRIKSYFMKEIGRGPTIDIMMNLAVDAKYVVTDSEIEAVILEAELIRTLKPKYNSRQKDDKSFLVIKISKVKKTVIPAKAGIQKIAGLDSGSRVAVRNDNKFPCVELVRTKNVDYSDKSAEYFGPYPAGLMLKKSMNYLRKIFPFRDCSKTKFNTYRKKGRPCIYGDIKVCTAPCVDRINEAEYKENISYFKGFLKGNKKKIVRDLELEMKKLSKDQQFEKAATLRDRLAALDHLKDVAIGLRDDVFSSSNILFKRIECYDISNIGGKYAVGSIVVFLEGKKSTDDYRHFKIRNRSTLPDTRGGNDLLMMKEILGRRFENNWPLPDLLVIDGGSNHLHVAMDVLNDHNLNIPVVSIAKGPKRDKNEFNYSNSFVAKYFKLNVELKNIITASRDEAHRFAINYYRKLHKQNMFK